MDFVQKIVDTTKDVITHDKMKFSLSDIKSACSDISPAISFLPVFQTNGVHIIAEVKKASPSAGVICGRFDPVKIAKEYVDGGASAISVLTEPTKFLGSLHALQQIREAVKLPLLRKDFIFDPYQIYQARSVGSDSFLLICSILEKTQLEDLFLLGQELGMEALIEVHSEDEMEIALSVGAFFIGINNRNLKTLEVDINTTKNLAPLVPNERVVVSESGISSHKQIVELRSVGVKGILIGETLMRASDRSAKLRELIYGEN